MTILAEVEQPKEPSQINAAVKADFPAIKAILEATIRTPYGTGKIDQSELQMELERVTNTLDSSGEDRILVAKDKQGQVLGFAFFGKPDSRITDFTHSDPETTTELRLLYLDPSKRRQGIGGGLLQAVEDEAKRKGMQRIELTSGPRYILIGSGRFYSKKGYRLVGTIENYFEGKCWAKVYQKELA